MDLAAHSNAFSDVFQIPDRGYRHRKEIRFNLRDMFISGAWKTTHIYDYIT
jgi:hypothetical protein